MEKISSRAPFFPKSRSAKELANERLEELQKRKKAEKLKQSTLNDAKVDVSPASRDFTKIKQVATSAPDVDNSEKIARLKQQISQGKYEVDYDKLAGKVLSEEFMN